MQSGLSVILSDIWVDLILSCKSLTFLISLNMLFLHISFGHWIEVEVVVLIAIVNEVHIRRILTFKKREKGLIAAVVTI